MPTATANKVKFNLKNVHYAKKTASGYATPVAIPGAVSLTLDAQGEINKFYADGVVYYQSSANNGYEGDLEIALIPDGFREDILGEVLDTAKVLIENADAEIAPFALGFQIDGDQNDNLFWFYNCTVTRPSTDASTTEDQKSPQTDKLSISCVADATTRKIRAKSTAETTAEVRTGWFNAVYGA